ncbi:MAG: leucine-rich repeat protein [Ruminococcus sp.]|nr:leucine-rich repeat protein [Ruminococcus sp.]
MKKHNRFIAGIMAVCLMGGITAIPESITPVVSMAESVKIIESGTCGDNLTWVFDDSWTLTISGTGNMPDFWSDSLQSNDVPWLSVRPAINKVVIEDDVTSIGEEAFYNAENLKSVIIADSVTSIGRSAFHGCSDLKEITIPDSVTSIGSRAFYDCKKLTSINIPDSVTSIGESTFHYCLSLTSIDIPDSVTSISDMAFKGCSSLTSITILNPECAICNDKDTITNGYFQDSDGYNYNDFKGTIYGYENSTAQAYAEECGYKFESIGKAPEKEAISGDVNGDNEFNVSDLVLIQKYLLGGSDTEISNWKQADLNGDGVLDVFDLCLMRKKLIEK